MSSVVELKLARDKLWKAQEKFNYFPDITIIINDGFSFNFNSPKSYSFAKFARDDGSYGIEPYLKCYLNPEILDKVLNRKVHWNNLELGCLILFDRKPNIYMPDVHTLMSFFHM